MNDFIREATPEELAQMTDIQRAAYLSGTNIIQDRATGEMHLQGLYETFWPFRYVRELILNVRATEWLASLRPKGVREEPR